MKKKVLFALIALFSFVGAWAQEVDPDPGYSEPAGIPIMKEGAYAFYLSTQFVAVGEDAPEVLAVVDISDALNPEVVNESDWTFGGVFKKNGNEMTKVSSLANVGSYYLQVNVKNTTYYVPFAVGTTEHLETEWVWNRATWEASKVFSEGEKKLYFHPSQYPYYDLYRAADPDAEPAVEEFAGNVSTPEEWAGLDDDQKAAKLAGYTHDWFAIAKSSVNRDKMFPQLTYIISGLSDGDAFNVVAKYKDADGNWNETFTQKENNSDDPTTYAYIEQAPNARFYWMVSIPQLYQGLLPMASGQDVVNFDSDYRLSFDANGTQLDAAGEPLADDATLADAVVAGLSEEDVKLLLVPAQRDIEVLEDDFDIESYTVSVQSEIPYKGDDTMPNIVVKDSKNKKVTGWDYKFFIGDQEVDEEEGERLNASDEEGNPITYTAKVYIDGECVGEGDFTVTRAVLTLSMLQIYKAYGDEDPTPVFKDGAWQIAYNEPGVGTRYMPVFSVLGGSWQAGDDFSNTNFEEGSVELWRKDLGEECKTENGSAIQYSYSLVDNKLIPYTTINDVKYINYNVGLGEASKLMIVPADLRDLDLITNIPDYVYAGDEKKPVDFKLGKMVQKTDADGNPLYVDPEDATKETTDENENPVMVFEEYKTANGLPLTFTVKEDGYANNINANVDEDGNALLVSTDDPATEAVEEDVYAEKATVTVEGTGNFGGEVTFPFNIKQLRINKANTTEWATGFSAEGNQWTFDWADNTGKIQVKNGNLLKADGTAAADADKVMSSTDDYTLTKAENADYINANISGDGGSWLTPKRELFVTIEGKGNYVGTVNQSVLILQRNIRDSKITVTIPGQEYTGEEITPEVTIKDAIITPAVTLTEDVEYTIEHFDCVDAGPAYSVISGKGNYYGTREPENWTIGNAELIIAAVDKSVKYGVNPIEFEFEVTGLKYAPVEAEENETEEAYNARVKAAHDAEDAVVIAALSPYFKQQGATAANNNGKNVGEYEIDVDRDEDDKPTAAPATYENYDVTYEAGDLSIIRAYLKIEAADREVPFGTDLSTVDFTEGLTISGWQYDDTDALLEGYTFDVQPNDDYTNKGEYANALEVQVTPATSTIDNYIFNLVPGDLTIGDLTLQIIAKNVTAVYGDIIEYDYDVEGLLPVAIPEVEGETAEETAARQAEADAAAVTAVKNALGKVFVADVYKYDEDGEVVVDDDEDWVIDDEKVNENGYINVGTYNLILVDDPEYMEETYDDGNYSINYVIPEDAKLSVTKRPVKVTADEQEIAYGSPIAQNAYVIESFNAEDSRGLMPGDALTGIELVQVTDATAITGRKADGATPHKNEIDPQVNKDNLNYDIVPIKADLYIYMSNAEIVLQRPTLADAATWKAQEGKTLWFREGEKGAYNYVCPAADDDTYESQGRGLNPDDVQPNTAAQWIADYAGQEVTVKFGHYAIEGNKWETLVLPFDVRVKDLSAALGYALVNVLDEENTDNTTMAFKKEIYTIEANTPFLVKVPYNIDLANVKFEGVEIVNPESAADLTVGEAGGHQFIGTYTGAFEPQNGTTYFRNGERQDGSSNLTVYALGAYIKFAPASASVRIITEDENGVTTEISGVEIAGAEAAAEGWYTLTGIKLEGKPATKGTYIYNGKAVYVK